MPAEVGISLDCAKVAGLFKAAGFLMSAGLALTVGFIGPARDAKGHTPRLGTRVAGLLTAIATGLIWTFLAEPHHRQTLAELAIVFGAASVGIFLLHARALRKPGTRRPTIWSLYLVALAVSGPVALSSTALLITLPKPVEVSISNLVDGMCFSPNALIEGTWQNLPAGYDIWIAASSADGRRFFPEDRKANVTLQGRWDSSLSYEPPAGTRSFYVRALLVTSGPRVALEAYARDPARMGIEKLPEGTLFADRKLVKTSAACSFNR